MYNTREEWLKEAINLLNKKVFNGDLGDPLSDYQVSCAIMGGKKLGEVIFPYDGEDVSLDDFFPNTIHIDEKIKDPVEIVEVLAHECIHCFMNIKGHGKAFASSASQIGFEKPFTQLCVGPSLALSAREIVEELGPWPGKAVIPHKKEKEKKKFTGKLFCPDCGFEVRVTEKMFKDHGENLPVCPCGSKMALDCGDDEEDDDE